LLPEQTSPGLWSRSDFQNFALCSCNLLGVCDGLLSCLVSSCRNYPHRDSNIVRFLGASTSLKCLHSSYK
jgi:hypothetical protein